MELRETVREHVTFTNGDILQGLGMVHLGATNQQPQTTLFNQVLSLLLGKQDFMEATIHTTSPTVADGDMARCTTPLSGMERENQYLLVITASVEQLNLGPSSINLKGPQLTCLGETHSKTHRWLPFSLGQPGQSVMELPL